MTVLGDFSSLLQLGFATGVGLSLFRAPIDIRVTRIARELQNEIIVVRGVHTEISRRKLIKLISLRHSFAQEAISLEGLQFPFLVVSVSLALLNLFGLTYVSLKAQTEANNDVCALIVCTSVVSYILLFAFLEIIARKSLSGIRNKLIDIKGDHSKVTEQP